MRCAVSELELPLRQLEVRLRSLQRRLLLMQLRCELLGILNRARTFLRQVLVARRLLLREYQRRLRLIHLRLAGVYLCVLNIDLRVDVLHARLRQLHRRLVLTDGDLVVGRVDHHQEITLTHVPVVDDRQLDDAPRDLRSHGDDIGAHGRVPCPRRPHIAPPHRPTEQPGKGDRGQGDQDRNNRGPGPDWLASIRINRRSRIAIILRLPTL